MTNTWKLRGRIAECGYTITSFATALGISRPALRKKLQQKVEFKASEIQRSCELLDIDNGEIAGFFFLK